MKSIACCPLTPDHLSAVVSLDQRCFGGLWTRDGYQRELDSPNSDLLILQEGVSGRSPAGASRPIGIGCSWAILDEAHITVLGIDPPYQGQGLGRWLLLHLLASARDRGLQYGTLEVRASNQAAIALYEKFGFRTAGRRRRYYADDEDALILWRGGLQDDTLGEVLHTWQTESHQRLQRSGWHPVLGGEDSLIERSTSLPI
jgi:ribosomal-protein-alanine N-acetyltransferase